MSELFGCVKLLVLIAGIIAIAELVAQPSQIDYSRWGRDWEHL
jgi:hypothetical protein